MKKLTKQEKKQLVNIAMRLQDINDKNEERRNLEDPWDDEIRCKIQDAIMAIQEIAF